LRVTSAASPREDAKRCALASHCFQIEQLAAARAEISIVARTLIARLLGMLVKLIRAAAI